ncbi:MAG: hypothetical protein KAV87_15930, partial [Desulfobacteraceae bacterium]|nr:hypothetical protein [Desulfobacteraceae bacterium]
LCAKWTARIQASALQVGINSISAYSLYDKTNNTYAKFRKIYKFDVTPDMMAGLTKKSLKVNDRQ